MCHVPSSSSATIGTAGPDCDLEVVALVRGTIMPGAGASAASTSAHNHHRHIAQTAAKEVREEALISKEVLNEIPPPEARVIDGKWEKKSVTSKGIIFQPKYAVLTASTLGFAKMIDGDTESMSHWMHSKKLSAKEWELEKIFNQF